MWRLPARLRAAQSGVEECAGDDGAERPDAAGQRAPASERRALRPPRRAERERRKDRRGAPRRSVRWPRPHDARPLRCPAAARAATAARSRGWAAARHPIGRRRDRQCRPARLPISTAIACSNCARVRPTSSSCACAPFSSCVSACTTSTSRDHASVVPVLRELERALVCAATVSSSTRSAASATRSCEVVLRELACSERRRLDVGAPLAVRRLRFRPCCGCGPTGRAPTCASRLTCVVLASAWLLPLPPLARPGGAARCTTSESKPPARAVRPARAPDDTSPRLPASVWFETLTCSQRILRTGSLKIFHQSPAAARRRARRFQPAIPCMRRAAPRV